MGHVISCNIMVCDIRLISGLHRERTRGWIGLGGAGLGGSKARGAELGGGKARGQG